MYSHHPFTLLAVYLQLRPSEYFQPSSPQSTTICYRVSISSRPTCTLILERSFAVLEASYLAQPTQVGVLLRQRLTYLVSPTYSNPQVLTPRLVFTMPKSPTIKSTPAKRRSKGHALLKPGRRAEDVGEDLAESNAILALAQAEAAQAIAKRKTKKDRDPPASKALKEVRKRIRVSQLTSRVGRDTIIGTRRFVGGLDCLRPPWWPRPLHQGQMHQSLRAPPLPRPGSPSICKLDGV